jgi:hypothetical protein
MHAGVHAFAALLPAYAFLSGFPAPAGLFSFFLKSLA